MFVIHDITVKHDDDRSCRVDLVVVVSWSLGSKIEALQEETLSTASATSKRSLQCCTSCKRKIVMLGSAQMRQNTIRKWL